MSPEVPRLPDLARKCRNCSRELRADALVCDSCHTLVYSERLDQIAAAAKELESQGHPQQARERWLSALALLPPSSTQAQWIVNHAQSLATADSTPDFPSTAPSPTESSAYSNVGRRGLLSFGTLLSFLVFVAIYSGTSGAKFGIGFAVLILIHEMGHYVDIRRRGLPADMPIFLPGIGAYVRWQALGVSLETRAAISLAGPLAGFLSAAACAILWWQTHNHYWAVLAWVGAFLNLLNLVPLWVLDGGHAALALGKRERAALLIGSLLLWAILRENALLVFAAGAAYRTFLKQDVPARSSQAIAVYFIAVLTSLAVLLHMLPSQGFGIQ